MNVHSPTQQPPKSTNRARQRDLVSRIKLAWQRDRQPDAVAFLSEHSAIRQNRSLAIDLAYEEYCIRREQGESLDAASFCRRFPSISRSLFRQIEVDDFLSHNPALLKNQATIEWPRHGSQLFEFAVVEEIGRGAFARAYLCAQPGVGNRQVVVKVSHAGAVEANTMGGLDHPNIMSVYSVQVEAESKRTGICMPFVGRSTLLDVIDVAFGSPQGPTNAGVILEASRALARRGDRYHQTAAPLPIRQHASYVVGVLQLAVQLADALAHAHERGVLHGDLKPSNIVMSTHGVPLIVDFNLSQSRDSQNLVTGGTLAYMAPEHIRSLLLGRDDEDPVDHRSDIFSLGAILHELLTGQPPFGNPGQPPAHCLEAGIPCQPLPAVPPPLLPGKMLDDQTCGAVSVRALNPLVSPALAELVLRCLAFEPQARPASMREVEWELRAQLHALRCWNRIFDQHRRATWTAVALCLALVAGMAIWSSQAPPLRDRQFQAGVAAYHAADYHAAIESLNAAIAADSEFAPAYLARGCAALLQHEVDNYRGWLDAAFRDLTLAHRYQPHPDIISARAYCLLKQEVYDQAAVEFELLLKRGSAEAAIYNNLGYCYEKMVAAAARQNDPAGANRRFADAEGMYRNAIDAAGGSCPPRVNLGLVLHRKYQATRDPQAAREGLASMRHAITLGADDFVTYFYAAKLAAVLAKVEGRQEFIDESLDHLAAALERGQPTAAFAPSTTPPFNVLANHPRLAELLRREPVKTPVRGPVRVMAPAVIASRFDFDESTAITVRARP